MNTAHIESRIQEMPLSFIRARHMVRAINFNYVNQLVHTIKRLGVKAFPLATTPEGVLFGGNHRFEAFMRLGLEKCWMHIYQPTSIDREAIELNEATEELLPMSFVDHAELIWRKLDAGQTQQQAAQDLGWSRDKIKDLASLQRITSEAWSLIGETFHKVTPRQAEQGSPDFGESSPFTVGLLQVIVPLQPEQQLELVQALAEGKIQKGKFKTLAQNYRARNEAADWIRQQLAGTGMIDRCLAEVAKGIYDAEWQTTQGPGAKLQKLADSAREEWERKNSITLIHGDFYQRIREVADGCVDLILTDPPYNIARENAFKLAGRSEIDQDFGEWDKHDRAIFISQFDAWAREFQRILDENGSGYVFTSDRYISHLREALERAGFKVKATLIWHKTNPGTQVVKTNFKSAVEYLLFFTKGEACHAFNWQGENEMHNCISLPICGGAERLTDAKGNTLHPTQKPLALLRHFLEISSHPGDMVFDGFMGVGSTARAARDMGRKFIGIEQDASFFEAAQRRMSDV
ncbi:MAG: DNA modification methylase [Magnetococcales bacterium]|nr:DNA modification methylase [Magnetococcales bacterium]